MKKIIAIALALVMTLALSVTCFAALPDDKTADVKATYTAGGNAGDIVYSVDVTFGDMEFTYTDKANKWNPETHAYDIPTGDASWASTTNTIEVTNHSNAAVNVTFEYAAKAGYTDITGSFDGDATVELPSAVGKATDAADLTVTKTLTLAGALASNTAAKTAVGTVTVSFS